MNALKVVNLSLKNEFPLLKNRNVLNNAALNLSEWKITHRHPYRVFTKLATDDKLLIITVKNPYICFICCGFATAFNSTLEELKFGLDVEGRAESGTFNSTLEELKSTKHRGVGVIRKSLLIAP